MKSKLLSIMLFAILCLQSVAFGLGKSPYEYLHTMKLYIDNTNGESNLIPFELDSAPYISDGRTMVPLRALGDSLGANVNWNAEKKEVTFTLGGNEVILTIGSSTALVNGKTTLIDAKPEIKNGRTFVPLRFVSEKLGAVVKYDGSQKSISIEYLNQNSWIKVSTDSDFDSLVPSDWTTNEKKSENYLMFFNSPLKTELMVAAYHHTIKSFFEDYKAEMIRRNWQVTDESLINENNPAEGYQMYFSGYDGQLGKNKIVYVKAFAIPEGVCAGISTFEEESFKYDFGIVNNIINQYYVEYNN